MSLPTVNLVIIGHKDHGKSTLIGRLLYDANAIPEQKLQEVEAELKKAGDEGFRFAFLLDSLEEERRGGLTIDIVQTPFKTKNHWYTIIDCPGHREFIKKMFTGASQADAAVLVASAKEGIQDQTKQHAFLIKTLGIKQLIVAVNKMDAVGYEEGGFKKMREGLLSILGSLGYSRSPVVPLSALNGENVFRKSDKMPWYKGLSLVETLDATVKSEEPPIDKPLRACVQDIYNIEGKKIVVCKILTGRLEEGKKVCFDPSGETAVVHKIEMFGKEVNAGEPGDSVGLVVDEVRSAKRGEVISYPQDRAKVVSGFQAETILFSDLEVRKGSVFTIRCGTAEVRCRVEEILERIDPVSLTVDAEFPEVMTNGDVGLVLFSPTEPMCVENFAEFPELGRFVVEGKKGTEAAGIVVKTNLKP
ncbi:MAG TPA: GTP-binding protein [Candidatus Bathyarchaeia archaeon]|nr:GTP-binding protein [Candidatus Bathyarchaeia archaeon]